MSSSYAEAYKNATLAALYSKYRPNYPKSLMKLLLDYLQQNGGAQDLAVDVGCGSGQGTFQLLEHFKQCLGVDISRAQIKEAQEKASSMEVKENVKFLVGDAAELPVETGTVDLVTAAAAWHWFPDKNKFYSECKRVLKQNGCLAVYSYTLPLLPASYHSTNKLIDQFYFDTLKDYWDESIQLGFNKYKGVVLPFRNVERHDIVMSQKATVADFIGFISSLASYQKFCEVHPGNSALQEFEQNIMTELTGGRSKCSAHEVQIDLEFSVFALLGQNNL